jgi:hypothetical protein
MSESKPEAREPSEKPEKPPVLASPKENTKITARSLFKHVLRFTHIANKRQELSMLQRTRRSLAFHENASN